MNALLLASALAIITAAAPASAEIDRLIKQLSSPSFAERKAATQALDAIGEPALAALEKAMASSDDAAIRESAERLRTSIRARLFGEVRRFEGYSGPVH